MASDSTVKVEINNKLAIITLNRPQKKNAINSSMYQTITRTLEAISNNREVAITALTGSGDYYSSGTDLKNSLAQNTSSEDSPVKNLVIQFKRFIEAFINHSKILVAVVNGPAVGVGVTTLGLCDIVFSVDTATFQTPFVKLGMSAEGCSSYTFPRIMGISKANDMLLFNRKITAKEAFEAGLISRLCTKEQLNTNIWPELRKNATELPMQSLFYSKQMIRRFDMDKLHEANRRECERLEERFQSEDCLNAVITLLSQKSKM